MRKKGFTLIELLVVIAIIGILALIVLVSLTGQRERAQIARGLHFSHNIHNVLGFDNVGVWNFGDPITDGEVTDVSGYGNHCSVVEAVATTGIVGEGLYFDGVNDHVNCGNPGILDITGDKITLSAWANLYSWPATDYAPVISKSWHYTMRFHRNPVTLEGKQFSARLNTVDGDVRFNHPAELNTWYHMALTYNGSAASFYVNGVEIESQDLTGDILHHSDPCFIGRYNNHYFHGIIDEVRIYNVTLAAGEIQKQYVEGLKKIKLAKSSSKITF